jgi:hypothetical protein
MKRILMAIFAALAGALVFAAAGTAEQSWSDPVGDSNGAPDLTALTVSNDAAGTVAMRFSVPLVPDTNLMVTFDSNLNGKLGDEVDRIIAVGRFPDGSVASFAIGWDASGNVVEKAIPSLTQTVDASTVTISFAKGDLGIGSGFAFWAETTTGAQLDQGVVGDRMPDRENVAWPYAIETAPAPAPAPPTTPATPAPAPAPAPAPVVKPRIAAPVLSPMTVVAGKRVTVSFPVTRSDTGAPLTEGKMVCDPSVAGKVLKHAESFKGGTARLSFLVPKSAKGKLLKVRVTITVSGVAVTKIATFKVR